VGGLTVIENILPQDLEDFKRIYILHNFLVDTERGNHAHKRLAQKIVCVSGSCELFLHDGFGSDTIELSSTSEFGIHINPGVWRTITSSTTDSTLIVFASHNYNADDYIHSFDEFIKWKGGLKI
jgi:dTDP-4-dehydrorhamnose 3,5-epimerase-like enzyme